MGTALTAFARRLRAWLNRAIWGLLADVVVRLSHRWPSHAAAAGLVHEAHAAARARNFTLAIIYARGAVAADPEWPDGYEMLAYAYLMAGDSRWARDVAERGLARWPEDVYLLRLLGDAHSALGDYDAAIAAYRRAVEREPDNADALTRLGIAEKLAGKLEVAADTLQRAHQLAPADPHIATALGETLMRMQDYPAAVRFCQEAVALDPARASAHFLLAVSLGWLGRHAEAREHADRAVELEPHKDEFRDVLRDAERADAFSRAWQEQREGPGRREPFSMVVGRVHTVPTGVIAGGRVESGFPLTGHLVAIETPGKATIQAQLTGLGADARPPDMVLLLTGIAIDDIAIGSRVRSLGPPS